MDIMNISYQVDLNVDLYTKDHLTKSNQFLQDILFGHLHVVLNTPKVLVRIR